VTRRKGGTVTTAHTNNGYAYGVKLVNGLFYSLFTLSLCPRPPSLSFLYTLTEHNCPTRQSPYDGEFFMSVLDGVSLLLAAGLFVYLLVALLRAGRVEE
jgi:K+-transporting ATPase ATPase F chain